MDLLQSIRRLMKRAGAPRARPDKSLPQVELQTVQTPTTRGDYFFPAMSFNSRILVEGQAVGFVDYGPNPLGDRIYIHKIEVAPEYQRHGYGLAALALIAAQYPVPMTPVHIYGSALDFWSVAREHLQRLGSEITDQLRSSQLEEEAKRWQHLVPEPENERLIREYWEWVESERAAGRPAGPGIK